MEDSIYQIDVGLYQRINQLEKELEKYKPEIAKHANTNQFVDLCLQFSSVCWANVLESGDVDEQPPS